MTATSIIGLLNILSSLGLAFFVFLKRPKCRTNQSYLLFGLAVALYSAGYFLWGMAQREEAALFAFKVLTSGIILINSAYLEFVFSILEERSKKRTILWMCHAVNLFFVYAVFDQWLFEAVIKKNIWGYWPIVKYLFYVYFICWAGQFFYGLSRLYGGYRSAMGQRATQIKYVFASTLIGYFGGATNWLPWFNITFFPPHLNILVTAYVAILAYAVVRHHLMEIEVIIKKTLVFAGVFGFMISVVAGITTLTQTCVGQFFLVDTRLSMSLSVAAAILLYDPVRKFLVEVTDRYLFQKKDDIKVILNQLAGNIIMILDISQVADKILATLRESLRLESGAIIIKDEKDKGYEVLESFNVAVAGSRYEADDIFLKYLGETKRIINLENAEEKNTLPASILGRLQDLRAVLCIPLFIHNELIGVLTLGKKKSDEEYTSEELDYLPTVASQVSIALSNARLYEILKKSQVDFAQQAKMAAIGTLSAGISHEIKNPLNHMRLAVGMLRLNKRLGVYNNFTKDQFEGEVFNAVERIDANITRATEVIERLSSFAKKPKEHKLEPVSLEKALENAFRLLDRELEHYGIAVKRNYTADLPLVSADAHAVEDVFLNLLVNARHAIKEKGTITVGTHLRGRAVEVAIRDTGCGISPENLEKIFDPFFTTKDTTRNPDGESVKGTGLGLFIVRELIKKLGGRIDVESEVGKGTCFRVTFPVLQEELAKGA